MPTQSKNPTPADMGTALNTTVVKLSAAITATATAFTCREAAVRLA
jgi:hypothetical protein